MKKKAARAHAMETVLIHGKSNTNKWDFSHHIIPPMSSSAAYRLGSAERGAKGFADYSHSCSESHEPIFIYDRLDEPTRGMLEDNLARAEGGDMCIAFSTGMGAISASICSVTKAGDEVICHKTIYGCTNSLLTNWLPRFNITTHFTDLRVAENVSEHINANTRVVYLETPANPTLDILDIKRICDIVKKANANRPKARKIIVVVDNTFATPYCQRPLELGADFSAHSLTKNICGFGTDMGGAIIAGKEWYSQVVLYRKDFGAALSPKAAWPILVYGLPTLPLRIKRQMESAMKVAKWLEKQSIVEQVFYPGLPSHPEHAIARKQMRDYEGKFAPGILLYFVIKGSPAASDRICRKIENYVAKNAYSITLAVSLGQIRTLFESPTSMTHAVMSDADKARAGMTGAGLRMSLGLEDPDDIINDLELAFKHAKK